MTPEAAPALESGSVRGADGRTSGGELEDPAILVTADDKVCAACIRGPETAAPTMAKLLAAGAGALS